MSQVSGDNSSRADHSPDSATRQVASGPRRQRQSRAGTRSVNTLSAAQLERKRANDREAQRNIRQRTKETIDGLKKDLEDATHALAARDGLLADARLQLSRLEEENAYLKNRLGATAPEGSFMLQVSGAGV